MRIIKIFEKEKVAQRFSLFLQKKEIVSTVEMKVEESTNKVSYELWVHDEDKIQEALGYLEEFEKDSQNPKFDVSLETIVPTQVLPEEVFEEKKDEKPALRTTLTSFILFLCIFIYLFNFYQEIEIRKKNPKISYVLLTPVQSLLLFDVPHVLIEVDEIIKKYQIDPSKDIFKQSIEAQNELEKIDKKPFWRGIYDAVLLKKEQNIPFSMKGSFEKIKEGQVWRLISPCFLHKDLLHLIFNMFWLVLLGKQVEQRISRFKYLLLILIIGIISNLSQYFMSGPYFLGYSGIIMGLVGFIWSREKLAPWEGYPLQKTIFFFLAIYVVLMFVLSFFSFVTQIVGMNLFTPNIANTAHLVGAFVGYLLGKMPFFSWSPKHER
jgi:GlpG protein